MQNATANGRADFVGRDADGVQTRRDCRFGHVESHDSANASVLPHCCRTSSSYSEGLKPLNAGQGGGRRRSWTIAVESSVTEARAIEAVTLALAAGIAGCGGRALAR